MCCNAGQLLVNFDKAMMQLIRETKHLQRMGVEVPESACQVLNQEEKFKLYFNQLTYALKVCAHQSAVIFRQDVCLESVVASCSGL